MVILRFETSQISTSLKQSSRAIFVCLVHKQAWVNPKISTFMPLHLYAHTSILRSTPTSSALNYLRCTRLRLSHIPTLAIQLASTSDASWKDNVFYGWMDTAGDALLALETVRRSTVPRVTRHFHDISSKKRNMLAK